MELPSFHPRSFTPVPMEIATIARHFSEDQVFSEENRKTARTFWIRIEEGGFLFSSECKRVLNNASRLADRVRQIFRNDRIWIFCQLQVEGKILPIYLKRTPQFHPLPERIYHLEPYITLEGSGRTAFSSKFIQSAYRIFEKMRKPTPENPYEIEKRATSSKYTLFSWGTNAFVIDTTDVLGNGSSKIATLAHLVEVVSIHHFRVSKKSLLQPIEGHEREVDFKLPHLKDLHHPNIGIPEEANLRYQIVPTPEGPIHKWCNLTYLGEDLDQAAKMIPNEKTLCRILLEMVAGVKYLCENHKFHEDLKPSNWILYTNDDGKTVVRLEDCEAIRSIEIGATSTRRMQTLFYLPLHLRKQLLNVLEHHESILNVRRSPVPHAARRTRYEFKESFSAMRNMLGLSMAQVWYDYRIHHSISEANRRPIEHAIQQLAIYPLRDTRGARFTNFYAYVNAGDSNLRKCSMTLEEIFAKVEKCPALEETEASLLKTYQTML